MRVNEDVLCLAQGKGAAASGGALDPVPRAQACPRLMSDPRHHHCRRQSPMPIANMPNMPGQSPTLLSVNLPRWRTLMLHVILLCKNVSVLCCVVYVTAQEDKK